MTIKREPIYVATQNPDCVATRCLDMERLDYEVLLTDAGSAYADHLARLWREGEGFVLVEDDIAPWPGAIHSLQECPQPWCAFPYHRENTLSAVSAHGCTKFSAELIAEHVGLESAWEGRAYSPHIDEWMLGTLRRHGSRPHDHSPPVAHARWLGREMR